MKPNLPPTIIGKMIVPHKNSANLPIFYSSTGWLWGIFGRVHHTGVVLGCGSIYNHSAEPNLGYRRVRVDASSEAVQGLSVPRLGINQPTGSRNGSFLGPVGSERKIMDGWV